MASSRTLLRVTGLGVLAFLVMVSYSIARLQLMDDLEGIALEPKGLRFDPELPVPELTPAAPE